MPYNVVHPYDYISEHGIWGDWGIWNDKGCGSARKCEDFDRQKMGRTRTCENPCKGEACSGPSIQFAKCNPRCCESF